MEVQTRAAEPEHTHYDAPTAGESTQPATDDTPKKVSQPTPRIVLARDTSDTGGYAIVGRYDGTEREAKRQAIEDNESVREVFKAGNLAIVAPPARGWNETEPQPEERIKGL